MIVEPDFCDHWKTRMLVGLLDNDEAAPVYVMRLWAHCQNRRQWVFEGVPPAAIAGICRYPGDAAKFDAAMQQCYIERNGDSIRVNGWDEYNKSLIKAWDNGKKGGRPPVKATPETHGLTQSAVSETQGLTQTPKTETRGVPDMNGYELNGIELKREERETPAQTTAPQKSPKLKLPERYDTAEVRQKLLVDWREHYQRQNPPERFDDMQVLAVTSNAQRLGWNAEKLVNCITHSIANGCKKTIIDCDHQTRGSPQGSAQGKLPSEPWKPPKVGGKR